MSALRIVFDEAGHAAWQAQMRRLMTDLGETKTTALRVGGLALLDAVQVSTRLGRRRRKIRVTKSARRKRYKGNRVFTMETLDTATGSIRNIQLFYPDLATAKLHPGAKIKNQGLAHASWGWAKRKLFGQFSADNYRGSRPTDVLRYLVSEQRGEADSFIEIENRLNYIAAALIGGRGPAVATACARAAGAMKGRIDQAIKKAVSEAGY